MTQSLYIASIEGFTGKSLVALGVVDQLARRASRVGVFRPLVESREERDPVLELLLEHDAVDLGFDECLGVTYDEWFADEEAALTTIVERYRAVARQTDVVVVVGSDYTDVTTPTELASNARIAANLGAPVLLVVRGLGRSVDEIRQVVGVGTNEITQGHATTVGVVVNRCEADRVEEVRAALKDEPLDTGVLPEIPVLSAPTVDEVREALGGRLYMGEPDLLSREAEHILVTGMNAEHIIERLREGTLVIAPADRVDAVLAVIASHAADGFPSLSGLVLNGGHLPSEQLRQLMSGLVDRLPVITTEDDTFETALKVSGTRGVMSRHTQRKRDLALGVVEQNLDADRLLGLIDVPASEVVTPLMFEATLLDRARSDRQHIVLPEGDDDRILRAASTVLSRQVADLTILGKESEVRARAAELGLDIDAARVVDPATSEHVEEFAAEYARLREHKGMTLERAREVITDVSYFGTLMVHLGLAGGMVSGAAHTTAHTIKPSFEIIKTRPGVSIVSSVFFMCLADRVLVYGDCAVNPDPTADQLADIAISSADTAAQFGVDPRIAMLSYSTGASGAGAEVEKVRSATDTVRERAAELVVEGPIQYDAAVDASVASKKLPGSEVAGRATVFIFPDLNTGNNTYKAVQRSAGAVAVGPVLQGLRKPVNDLSRGALVGDIVNTVAITAVQAQAQKENA
ncbi:phosphate acetyltransferase [Georgenia sp. Z1491]|uniref:phosphate acetyltransferase n=1 Tax=Georgenia sp. Z1491 TaxID=3416707 RepID=UPI003CF0FE0F